MFLMDWFYGALGYLGLYHKNAKILFLGLEAILKRAGINLL